jgi:protein-S-isoprenylcysteine O-methyltransferase Ste14
MKNKMTWSGIGPKLALITLPYIVLSVVLTYKVPGFLKLNFINPTILFIAGYLFLLIGIIFYIATAYTFFKYFGKERLITLGTYRLCRNPIYATFIIFIVPALSFIFQSGIILTIDLVLYINFKMAIHGEYIMLRKNFGEEYDKYEKSVNEIIPIPKFWIKK